MAWKYFKFEDFECKHCGKNLQSEEFITKLDALREDLGFALVVNSGYRCPEYNATVSSTGLNGPHTTGLAVDLAVDRERAVLLLEAALFVKYFRGFGINQKGGGRFVHLDATSRPTRTIWSY